MSIYSTVLYIKQHSITGLKYFGKTTKSDPYKYNGSGKHWLRHIKLHGEEHIETLWVSEPYTDAELISEFALKFSKENNIVESKDWANLIEENGLDGSSANKGKNFSEETKAKMSGSKLGNQNRLGILHTEEAKLKCAKGGIAQRGIPKKKITCPHCNKIGSISNMKRYHFDNCQIVKRSTT